MLDKQLKSEIAQQFTGRFPLQTGWVCSQQLKKSPWLRKQHVLPDLINLVIEL